MYLIFHINSIFFCRVSSSVLTMCCVFLSLHFFVFVWIVHQTMVKITYASLLPLNQCSPRNMFEHAVEPNKLKSVRLTCKMIILYIHTYYCRAESLDYNEVKKNAYTWATYSKETSKKWMIQASLLCARQANERQ